MLVGAPTEYVYTEPREDSVAIELTHDQAAEIIAHARHDYPNECCGLLGGHGSRVERVFPMVNVEASPLNFRMDPKQLYQVLCVEMEELGLEHVGIYHSHTHSPAYPSPTDVRHSHYPEQSFVIVSLADPERPVIRSFRIVDGKITEEEVIVR